MKKYRVMIIDDSSVIRNVLKELLSDDPEIEIVAMATDPYDAREKIKLHRPSVLTLDIEMPKMDGITFLRNLMKLNPLPVIMLSTLTHQGADATLQALELGAIDFMPKPTIAQLGTVLKTFQNELIAKIKVASALSQKVKFIGENTNSENNSAASLPDITNATSVDLIAIGASTGGIEAIRSILEVLPKRLPPIIITQHIPENFSERLARRLNTQCALTVKQAEDGEALQLGHVYVACGGKHLKVIKDNTTLRASLDDSEPINRHKPSVEVMFDSLATEGVSKTVCIMLTGMGDDGALAMKRLRDLGHYTIAQDEQSSMVWGMPGMAVKYGAAEDVLALKKIPEKLIRFLSKN